MRKAPGPPHGKAATYVPRAYGNREAPEADRVSVVLRYPSAAEKREVMAGHSHIRFVVNEKGEPCKDASGNAIVEVDAGGIDKRNGTLVAGFVENVTNYVDSCGEPIDTGAKLAQHGEDGFVSEIAEEIWRGASLTADEGKDYAGSSDSSPAEISPLPLTVANAGGTDGTKVATADASTSHPAIDALSLEWDPLRDAPELG